MITRVCPAVALLAALIATGCDRTETSSAKVTTSSPAGSSTVPSSDAARQRDNALVRVLHAVPSGTTFDLYAGDLLLFDGLGFKTVTPYRAVDSKRYAFALRPAGMTQAKPLSSNTEDLTDGAFYTAIAMPSDDGQGPHLRVVSDHLDSPASGKARLRVVHAGAGAGRIDVRAEVSAMLFDALEYRSVSDYRNVAPMNGQLQIVGAGRSALLAATTAHLEAGRFYTLVIVSNAAAPARVEAFLIEDALSP